MAFPSTIESPDITMQGTTTLAGDDHAQAHRVAGSAVIDIQNWLGTNSASNGLFNSYTAGQQPLPIKSGTLGTIISSGTINNGIFGSQSASGGTFTAPTLAGLGTNSGTILNGVYNNPKTGTLINIGGLSLKDNGSVTQTGTADHITLTPGASKLVRTSVLQQNGTTNSYVNNAAIQNGWTWMAGANGTMTAFTQTITFGVNFTSPPIVTIGQLGAKVGSDPTTITDGTQTGTSLAAYLIQITSLGTASFLMNVYFAVPPNNGARPMFTWQAIGPI